MFTITNRSPKYSAIKKDLIILTIGHLFLAVLHFIGGRSSIFKGFRELLCASLTIMAFCMHHYCILAFYILLIIINSLSALVKIGLSIQHDILYKWDRYFFIVAILSDIFYIFGIYIALYIYKEFKYSQLFGSGAEFQIDVNKPYYSGVDQGATLTIHNTSQQPDFNAFTGKGVAVG
jgi:hypothetical protein